MSVRTYIDYAHQKIHEGKGFVANYIQNAVPDNNIRRLRLTAANNRAMHVVIGIDVTGKFSFKTYEGTTYTVQGTAPDGTTLTAFNRILGRDGRSGIVRHNPTVDELGALRASRIIPGGTGPQSTGTTASERWESIIPPGHDLLLVFQNLSGQAKDLDVTIDWYEEVLDLPTPLDQLKFETLTLEDPDETAIDLTPTFDSDTNAYTADLTWHQNPVTIEATVADVGDVEIEDAAIFGVGEINFPVGETVHRVDVYKQGYDSNAYFLTVTREPLASLATLTLTAGEDAVPLTPAFDPEIFAYTATVDNEIESVTVAATEGVEDGVVGGDIGAQALSVGENTITVTCTLEDHTTGTYVVLVTREAA